MGLKEPIYHSGQTTRKNFVLLRRRERHAQRR
nr:MAG TPA: hypothetical protein [Caudoviricetes sp.]DAL19793.1 MAG TPA_asm: hypothetical protein [Caudoviricetes sp.]